MKHIVKHGALCPSKSGLMNKNIVNISYNETLNFHSVVQRVNAVASAAIGLGIAVGARGLTRGRMGQDPPRQGWRMHDEIAAAIDGPINYAHLMSSEAFGAPN